MVKYLILAFIFLTTPLAAKAEMAPVIVSGRPGQSIGPGVVGSGTFQIQSGVNQNWLDGTSNRNSKIFNNVFRLGLTESFEMSSVLEFRDDTKIIENLENRRSGISQFHVGFRSVIFSRPNGLLPGMAVQTRFRLDAVGRDYGIAEIAPIITTSMLHQLGSGFSLIHNIGASYDGHTIDPTFFGTSNLLCSLGEKWGTFFEVYGNVKNNPGSVYLDSGGWYFVNNDLKIDFSAGWGNNFGNVDIFVSVGFSWRTALFGSLGLNSMDDHSRRGSLF